MKRKRSKVIEEKIERGVAGMSVRGRWRLWRAAYETLCCQSREWRRVLFVLPAVVVGGTDGQSI